MKENYFQLLILSLPKADMGINMKKILVTSTELMMLQFLVPHINNLCNYGYEVEIACSEVGGRFKDLKGVFLERIKIYKVRLQRNPFNIDNIKGYRDLKRIINHGNYDLIWTNEPVMSVMTRLASKKLRKKGMKVLYLTHGFHFYQGSQLHNWILYYPVETILSYITDLIITINKEDYHLAKKMMHAGRIAYIPGIGLDTECFRHIKVDKTLKRRDIGVPEDGIMILSLGELAKRKNHEVIIKALAKLDYDNIYYVICGKGKLKKYLMGIVSSLGLEHHVIFLGFRFDTKELCQAADIFAHPSRREGLGIAALEGMAAGLPLIVSEINGIKDYTVQGKTGYGFYPDDIYGFAKAIDKLSKDKELRTRMGKYNQDAVKKYDINNSKKQLLKIIKNIFN